MGARGKSVPHTLVKCLIFWVCLQQADFNSLTENSEVISVRTEQKLVDEVSVRWKVIYFSCIWASNFTYNLQYACVI